MALVGDNGAGKSTLIKCIAGIHPIDEGEVVFDGSPVTIHGPKDAAAARASRSSTRTSRWPTTSTSSRTCSSAARRSTRSAPARRDQDGGQGARDAQEPLGDHDPLRAPDRRRPLRRPAPVGRGRQGGDVELAGGDPRRADRGARRRADQAGARPRGAARRAGPGRDPDLAQPARHLPGGRLDHRAAARPERRRVQAARDQPAGGRRGDHRRPALEGPGPGEEAVA